MTILRRLIAEGQIMKVVAILSSVSCKLDPIPTKTCTGLLSPALAKITKSHRVLGYFR